jgi:hypothetical protein
MASKKPGKKKAASARSNQPTKASPESKTSKGELDESQLESVTGGTRMSDIPIIHHVDKSTPIL